MQRLDAVMADLSRLDAANGKLFDRINFLQQHGKQESISTPIDEELGDPYPQYLSSLEGRWSSLRLLFNNVMREILGR